MKKLDSRSRVTKKMVPAAKSKDTNADLRQQLEDLTDKIDLVLPEVTARVAALEHLLREGAAQQAAKVAMRMAEEILRHVPLSSPAATMAGVASRARKGRRRPAPARSRRIRGRRSPGQARIPRRMRHP